MNSLGMPQMPNHSGSQMSSDKKMSMPDTKNTANFASAFKNKVKIK